MDAVESILNYWFGDRCDWRGGLWFQGIDPSQVNSSTSQKQKLANKDAAKRTDAFILKTFGPIIDTVMAADGTINSECFETGFKSLRGQLAIIILLDQFPRNAYRGTPKMFAYDAFSSRLAIELAANPDFKFLPWNFKLFTFVCLTHSEQEDIVSQAALGFSSLIQELQHQEFTMLAKKITRILHSTEDHLTVLQRFGRYPHRNALLGRINTTAEVEYLSGKLPTWAKSVEVYTVNSNNEKNIEAKRNHLGINILVLHGNKQHPASFIRSTKAMFGEANGALGQCVNLTVLPGKHVYAPQGSAAAALDGISVNDDRNLCWWNATDDPDNMTYVGLEESIEYIDNYCRDKGPFHGILGFSQGACLAGIIAQLQQKKHPLVKHCKFQFVVPISGFCCRDQRPVFHMNVDASALDLPSFHIYGKSDALIVPERSEKLAKCFVGPSIHAHSAGHFHGAISHWPISVLVDWLEGLQSILTFTDTSCPYTTTSSKSAVEVEDIPLDSFEQKFEMTQKQNANLLQQLKSNYLSSDWGKARNRQRTLKVLQPYGLVHKHLLDHAVWKEIVDCVPILTVKSLTRDKVAAFIHDCFSSITEISSSNNSCVTITNDCLLLAYCVFPYAVYIPPHESTKLVNARRSEQGEVFYWMLESIMRCAYGSSATLKSGSSDKIRENLDALLEIGDWNDIMRFDLLICTGSSRKIILKNAHINDTSVNATEDSLPCKKTMVLNVVESTIHSAIIDLICTQLQSDLRNLGHIKEKKEKIKPVGSAGDTMSYDKLVTEKLEHSLEFDQIRIGESSGDRVWDEDGNASSISQACPSTEISSCVTSIPRMKSYTERTTGLAISLARRLFEMKLISEGDSSITISGIEIVNFGKGSEDSERVLSKDEKLNIGSSVFYRHVVTALSQHVASLNNISSDYLTRLKATEARNWKVRAYASSSEDEYQALIKSPLSHGILFPEPEPVDVSSREEMAQLHKFFHEQNKNSSSKLPIGDGDVVFQKGTLCGDGRLDLCKQVVGPSGIESLMSSLALDSSGQHQVEHLLLGNNICGDELGSAIAKLILSGDSGLTTWYIAGNRLTEKGIAPICDVLSHDQFVLQLWLKRNPLMAPGAALIANMMKLNTHIVVLDMVNTGIGDVGGASVFSCLGEKDGLNSTLRHLYIDGNGFTIATAALVGSYLKSGVNRLSTLSLGCSRFGNEGAALIMEGLSVDTHLTRLGLASVGLGAVGGEAVATMLKVNTTLLHLDLGLMKFTAALGEIPNRIGVVGTIAIADVLRYHNNTLLSLVLLNNNVFQSGIAALRSALLGDVSPTMYSTNQNSHGDDHTSSVTPVKQQFNVSLVRLELEQMGVPYNELTREEIRLAIRRNYLSLSAEAMIHADEAQYPVHLNSIQSVYRTGGAYSK